MQMLQIAIMHMVNMQIFLIVNGTSLALEYLIYIKDVSTIIDIETLVLF